MDKGEEERYQIWLAQMQYVFKTEQGFCCWLANESLTRKLNQLEADFLYEYIAHPQKNIFNCSLKDRELKRKMIGFRNYLIRARYKELLDGTMKRYPAMAVLAEEFNLSIDTIKNVIAKNK
jgi:hypothetical protein